MGLACKSKPYHIIDALFFYELVYLVFPDSCTMKSYYTLPVGTISIVPCGKGDYRVSDHDGHISSTDG